MSSVNDQMPSMGVLKFHDAKQNFRLSRYAPSADIAPFVKHYWVVSWDLVGQDPYTQDVVPNPCVNMVIEHGRTAIYGPAKSKFSYLLQENGLVFGVKFKPGGFYPFLKSPVSRISTRGVGIQEVFDVDTLTFEKEILAHTDERQMAQIVENMIRRKLPQSDDNLDLIQQLIEQIINHPEITKVDDLCQRCNINKRKLQRLFDQYVGVGPKWVIMLYRLQNAADKIENHESFDWSQLSAELGYYDQAHFIKDFKSIVGHTPQEYASAAKRRQS